MRVRAYGTLLCFCYRHLYVVNDDMPTGPDHMHENSCDVTVSYHAMNLASRSVSWLVGERHVGVVKLFASALDMLCMLAATGSCEWSVPADGELKCLTFVHGVLWKGTCKGRSSAVSLRVMCAGVYAVLGRRRARVVREEMREGSDLFSIHAYLPAQASFGFANDMRRQSSGDKCPAALMTVVS